LAAADYYFKTIQNQRCRRSVNLPCVQAHAANRLLLHLQKAIGLRRSREMLKSPSAAVSGVAVARGFAKLGYFLRDLQSVVW
jgi:hypothetical protein